MSTPRIPHTRRGFTFLLVLGLLALAVITLGVGLERQRTQGAIVAMQAGNIQRHHELLSVRDIAGRWFVGKDITDDQLLQWAAADAVAAAIRLPGGRVIQIRVSDGQGAVCARLDRAERIGMRDTLLDILRRLPEGRGDLIRRSGPIQISFNGAPPEVIDALAGDDLDFARAMHDLQGQGVADRDAFTTAMEAAGLNSEDFAWALELLDFRPVLWRLWIDVLDGAETREYTVLVERRVNIANVYEWKSIPVEVFDPTRSRGTDDGSAPGRRSADNDREEVHWPVR